MANVGDDDVAAIDGFEGAGGGARFGQRARVDRVALQAAAVREHEGLVGVHGQPATARRLASFRAPASVAEEEAR